MPINNPTPAIKPPKVGQPYGATGGATEDPREISPSQFAAGPVGDPVTGGGRQGTAGDLSGVTQYGPGGATWDPIGAVGGEDRYAELLRAGGANYAGQKATDVQSWLSRYDARKAAGGAAGGGGSTGSVAGDMMAATSGGAASPGGTPEAQAINPYDPAGMWANAGTASAGAGGGLGGDVNQAARDLLRNPSRFDIPLVQQGTQLIDQDLADQREQAIASIDEFNASRGRTGSTFENQERRELASDLERQRMQRLFDLNMAMANTYGADRAGALGAARDVLQGDRTYGLDQQAVDLRAQELQQEYELSGRSLDIDEARMLSENEQFRANLNQRESEFARSLGMEEKQFQAEQAQFGAQMAEQIAGRLQQENQFARSLASEESRAAMDAALRRQALELQQQGMNLDEAFRRAELQVESGIRTRALDLQREGMNLDEAYRRAALESENWRVQQELQLQSRSIGDTARLSQLDILLRALGSGLDPDEIAQYLGGMGTPQDPVIGGPPSTGTAGGVPTQNTGNPGSGAITALLELLRQQGG